MTFIPLFMSVAIFNLGMISICFLLSPSLPKCSLRQLDDLAGHETQFAVLVKHCVQVLNPLGINLRICIDLINLGKLELKIFTRIEQIIRYI